MKLVLFITVKAIQSFRRAKPKSVKLWFCALDCMFNHMVWIAPISVIQGAHWNPPAFLLPLPIVPHNVLCEGNLVSWNLKFFVTSVTDSQGVLNQEIWRLIVAMVSWYDHMGHGYLVLRNSGGWFCRMSSSCAVVMKDAGAKLKETMSDV